MKQKFTVFDAINYLLFILITIVCIYRSTMWSYIP